MLPWNALNTGKITLKKMKIMKFQYNKIVYLAQSNY